MNSYINCVTYRRVPWLACLRRAGSTSQQVCVFLLNSRHVNTRRMSSAMLRRVALVKSRRFGGTHRLCYQGDGSRELGTALADIFAACFGC
jgi:hypothetical protein